MSDECWEPVPVPLGDGKHDIGDDASAAIFHRLHDDFTLAAPWMTAEQRRHLAMFAAASVRALLHEIGTLRDMTEPIGPAGGALEGEKTEPLRSTGTLEPAVPVSEIRALIAKWRRQASIDSPINAYAEGYDYAKWRDSEELEALAEQYERTA